MVTKGRRSSRYCARIAWSPACWPAPGRSSAPWPHLLPGARAGPSHVDPAGRRSCRGWEPGRCRAV